MSSSLPSLFYIYIYMYSIPLSLFFDHIFLLGFFLFYISLVLFLFFCWLRYLSRLHLLQKRTDSTFIFLSTSNMSWVISLYGTLLSNHVEKMKVLDDNVFICINLYIFFIILHLYYLSLKIFFNLLFLKK